MLPLKPQHVRAIPGDARCCSCHKPPAQAEHLSCCSLVGPSEQGPCARGRRDREPQLCACCLHHHIWEKWLKHGDAAQGSPYPARPGSQARRRRCWLLTAAIPPLLALSPIETGPSRMGTPGILPPASGAAGWLVHAGTPAPRVARVSCRQHCQPRPRLLPRDHSTSRNGPRPPETRDARPQAVPMQEQAGQGTLTQFSDRVAEKATLQLAGPQLPWSVSTARGGCSKTCCQWHTGTCSSTAGGSWSSASPWKTMHTLHSVPSWAPETRDMF